MQDKLEIKVTANASQFKQELEGAKKGLSAFGNSQLKGMVGQLFGAAAIAQVSRFSMSVIQTGDAIGDAAQAAGVGVEAYQALAEAAREGGSSSEQMTTSLAYLRNQIGEALNTSGPARDAFKTLGISMDDIANMDPAQVFELLSQKLTSAGGDAQTFNTVSDLIGRRNLPYLTQVIDRVANESLPGLISSLKDANRIMSEDTVRAMSDASDAMAVFDTRKRNATALALTYVSQIGAGWGALSAGATLKEAREIGRNEDPAADAKKRAKQFADKDAIEKAEKAEQRYQEMKAKFEFDALSRAEKMAQLAREIAGLEKATTKNDQERFTVLGDIEERKAKLRDMEKQEVEEDARASEVLGKASRDYNSARDAALSGQGITVSAPQAADSMAAIGAYIGGQSNPMQGELQRQTQILQNIERIERQYLEQLSTLNGGFAP